MWVSKVLHLRTSTHCRCKSSSHKMSGLKGVSMTLNTLQHEANGFQLFFWWKMRSGSSSTNVKRKFKPTDKKLMFFNPLSKSFGSDQQWDTLPCESVILVLQLVDKTDQGVLQVGHLTDEGLQGQLQLLLLSLKKGKTDMGGGQRHPITHASIIQSVLQTASSSEEEEILEIKILLFPTDPFPLGQTT